MLPRLTTYESFLKRSGYFSPINLRREIRKEVKGPKNINVSFLFPEVLIYRPVVQGRNPTKIKDAQVNLDLIMSLSIIMIKLTMLKSPFRMVVIIASLARMSKRLSLTLKVFEMYLKPLKLAAKPNPDMPTKA